MPFIPNYPDAAYPDQAEPDSGDIEILLAGIRGNGVLSGCEVTVGVPFSPADVAGLVGWYDYGDPSTLYTDNGTTLVSADSQLIYRANDKSGNGNHLLQTTSGSRPLYKVAAQNGLSVAETLTDRVEFHENALNAGSQPFTVFVGALRTANTGGQTYDAIGQSAGNWRIGFGSTAVLRMYAGSNVTGGTASNNVAYIFTGLFNGSSSKGRINGTEVIASDVGSAAFGSSFVTHHPSAGTDGTDTLKVFEICIYSGDKTADFADIEGYLRTKWGTA